MLGSPLTYLGMGGLAPPDHHPPSSPTNHLLQVFPCRSALLNPRQLLQTNKLHSLAWVVPQVYLFSYFFSPSIPPSACLHQYLAPYGLVVYKGLTSSSYLLSFLDLVLLLCLSHIPGRSPTLRCPPRTLS